MAEKNQDQCKSHDNNFQKRDPVERLSSKRFVITGYEARETLVALYLNLVVFRKRQLCCLRNTLEEDGKARIFFSEAPVSAESEENNH
jgi:hypothetical protein